MNSSKKKTRRKVSIRCRKISSTSNKSQLSTSHVASAGNYKRRITSLLRNNKTLAVALQDARCELSTKRKILEGSSEYLNKIKFARFKMLEMYSVLKTFVKDFDEALLLLNFDDSKWLDFRTPTRLCTNFKSKMSQVVETDEVSEGVSIDQGLNFVQERVKSSACSSDQMISNAFNSSNVFCKEIAERVVDEVRHADDLKITNQSLQDGMENISSTQTVDIDPVSESHPSPVSFCEGPKNVMETTEEKEISSKNMSPLKNDEGSRTPKLSISLQTVTDLEAPLELKSSFSHENCPLSTENRSKILINPPTVSTSQKGQTSKIPRIQDLSDKTKGPKFSKNCSKEIMYKRKFVRKGTEELDSNFCQRKTSIIKDSDISNSESSATLSKNLSNIDGESDILCRRKTFVVKASDILEEMPNSESDKRKTFVKKPSNQSTSVKNRRDTFTVAKRSEDIDHTENLHISNDVSVINDKPQEDIHLHTNDLDINIFDHIKGKPTAVENPENSHHILDNTEISTGVNIPLKTHPKEILETGEILIARKSNTGNTADKSSEELKTKVCCDVEDKQNEVEVVEEDIKIRNRDVTSDGDLPNGVENEVEVIDISGNINGARPRKHVPYKLFLESSSESECESIPDDNLNFIKEVSSIKTTPIRRCISNTKNKKVFVFDGNKRKSILSKKSVNKCINSKMSPTFSKESTETYLSNVTNAIENQRVKNKKNVTFVSDEQINKNDPVDNVYSDSCNNIIPASKLKSKELSKKKYKCSDIAAKDHFASGVCHENSLSVTANKNFSTEVKQSRKTLNKEHNTVENTLCKSTEIACNMENKTNKCHKARNAKRSSPKDDNVVDDLISVAKKSKKNNLRKKPDDNICVEEGAVISNMENGMNNLIKGKSLERKAKNVKKAKSKVKKDPPCKKTGKNTFLVHAEVHPQPSSANMPEIEKLDEEMLMQNLNKENKEILGQNFQVSVVLSDVLKSENIDNLNISCEKDLILSRRTFPLKTHFLDSSCNIPQAPVESTLNVYKNVVCDTNNSEKITTTRRKRKDVKSYKEPSLIHKLRQ